MQTAAAEDREWGTAGFSGLCGAASAKNDAPGGSGLQPPDQVQSRGTEDRATAWINKLTAVAPELSAVRDALVGGRAEMLDRVRDFGLPHTPYAYASVDAFLADPEALVSKLKGGRFFYVIQPADYAANIECPKPRVGALADLVRDAARFCRARCGETYLVVASEARDVAYLGNIVVNEEGDVHGEFTDESIPPTRIGVRRLYHFWRHESFNVFRYDFDNQELREAIYRSVRALPCSGTSRTREWAPGYYELCLCRGENGMMAPEFYDVRRSKPFLYVRPAL